MPATITSLSPLIAIHLTLALAALVLGPLALWARKGSCWHRAAGYAWVTLMLGAALSAVFIARAIWYVSHGNVLGHRRAILGSYAGLVIAGGFALLPSRRLGMLVWQDWLGWM